LGSEFQKMWSGDNAGMAAAEERCCQDVNPTIVIDPVAASTEAASDICLHEDWKCVERRGDAPREAAVRGPQARHHEGEIMEMTGGAICACVGSL
jgi:hypothetical protein